MSTTSLPLIQVSATIIELGRANPNGRVHATYPGSPFYAPSSGIDHETEAAAIKRRDRFRLNAVAVAAVDVDQHKGNGRVIRIKGEREGERDGMEGRPFHENHDGFVRSFGGIRN